MGSFMKTFVNDRVIGVESAGTEKNSRYYNGSIPAPTAAAVYEQCYAAGYDHWSAPELAAESSVFLAPAHKTHYIKNGSVVADHTKGRVKAVTLLVPLLSAAWGHLIPPEARKLIPAKALEKMIIEI